MIAKPMQAFEQWANRLEARWYSWLNAWQQKRRDGQLLKEERKRRKRLHAELLEDAWHYIDRIQAVSARMPQLNYRYKQSERDIYDSKVATIKFTHCVMQPEAIYLQVDTLNLPRGVSISSIRDEDALLNFSGACRKRISFDGDEERGYWLIADRASTGVRGIPSHVRLDEVWAMRDKTHDGLAIPFGITANKKLIWLSFNRFQSILIGGATGGGKSNIINLIICTLVRFNSPKRVKLGLIDLKGGVELSQYEDLPHILRYRPLGKEYDPDDEEDETASEKAEEKKIDATLDALGDLVADDEAPADDGKRPAFVDTPKKVLPLLLSIYWEGRRRLRLLRRAKVRDIGTYNWRNPKRAMSHIVIIFDELAEMQGLKPAEQAKCQLVLSQIAGLFRAAGIHCVPATQRPTKEVITGNIIGNCPARIAFNCANVTSSTLIIGNGLAVGLSPAGRAILDWGGKTIELQTPYLPDRIIEQVIEQAKAGQYEDVEVKRHDVSDDEIFRVGLEQFAGDLQGREIHNFFFSKGRGIPRQEVYDVIKRYLHKQIMVNGVIYTVLPGQGSRPPRLEVIEAE